MVTTLSIAPHCHKDERSHNYNYVIIEIGSFYCKVGLDRFRFPMHVICVRSLISEHPNLTSLYREKLTDVEVSGIMECLFQRIYSCYCPLSPLSTKVMLILNDFFPKSYRKCLVDIIARKFQIYSVCSVSSLLTPLYLFDVSSALLIDIGYYETRIIPVCFGTPLYHLYKVLNIGSFTVTTLLRELLIREYTNTSKQNQVECLSLEYIDWIKENCCYIRYTAELMNETNKLCSSVNSTITFESEKKCVCRINSELELNILPTMRWKPCEIIFDVSESKEEFQSVIEAVYNCIDLCPCDIKRFILRNTIICGGYTNFSGFIPRFSIELSDECLLNNIDKNIIPSVLKPGNHEDIGDLARMQSFVSAISVGELVKSTLGPYGTDKILQPMGGEGSHVNKTMITNDGATILQSVLLDNPAAKMLVDVSKQQDKNCGDGTTGVVILASELIRNAEALVDAKIHPQVIIAGYNLALNAAKTALYKMKFSNANDPVKWKQDLINIAKTTLSSKLLKHEKEMFANFAVEAVLRLRGKANLDYIQIIKKCGGSLKDSFLEEGFILEKSLGIGSPKKITNCKIMIANTSMDTDKIKIYGARVKVDSFDAVHDLEKAEKMKMKDKVDKIVAHGCNVFINRQLIYNYPEQLFKDKGVVTIEHSDFDGTERLTAVLGAQIVSTFDNPDESVLGYCETIEEIMIGTDKVIRFSNCKQNEACTIVLRGANYHILDEAERSLHDALAVLVQLVQDKELVYGGGAPEMSMAEAVFNAAKNVEGKKSLSMDAFGKALTQIPAIIANNCGFDSAEIVANLRVKHNLGHNYYGIDISTGGIGDTREMGLFESYKCKYSQLCSSVQAAEAIIRVDNIIRCAPRERKGM